MWTLDGMVIPVMQSGDHRGTALRRATIVLLLCLLTPPAVKIVSIGADRVERTNQCTSRVDGGEL
jgi:hypothetical protein